MPPVIIDNPILNSPYQEPTRHWHFDNNDQITNVIDPGRRDSSYFLPTSRKSGRKAHTSTASGNWCPGGAPAAGQT
jgi:hypothetical protein